MPIVSGPFLRRAAPTARPLLTSVAEASSPRSARPRRRAWVARSTPAAARAAPRGGAHPGTEAIRGADALRPDLLLLDISLPDVSGLDVLHELRHGRGLCVDVIAITLPPSGARW